MESRAANRPVWAVAQLGARVNGIHEVTGSTPVWSTTLPARIPRRQYIVNMR